jgi:hypothetical protein
MALKGLIDQLGKRRVFRATAIYAAAVWVAIQAADVFAGEGIVSERFVQWLIVASVIGLPLVLLGSWFIEAPWKARSKVATLGDLFIIAAIMAGAGLFAWQQWFISGTHMPIAVAAIEATDLQAETEALATHLETRFTELLAAEDDAELRLAGTLVRGGDRLRLTARLEDEDGNVLWSESFERALADFGSLQLDVVDVLAAEMASLRPRRLEAVKILEECRYPANADAIVALVVEKDPAALAQHIEANVDNGLLFQRQSLLWFEAMERAPMPEKPVFFALATRSLDSAAAACPGNSGIEDLRDRYTRTATP